MKKKNVTQTFYPYFIFTGGNPPCWNCKHILATSNVYIHTYSHICTRTCSTSPIYILLYVNNIRSNEHTKTHTTENTHPTHIYEFVSLTIGVVIKATATEREAIVFEKWRALIVENRARHNMLRRDAFNVPAA